MSGTADSSASTLFRRLGVTGGGSSHFNGGRFGKSSEPVSKDVLKLFASVLWKYAKHPDGPCTQMGIGISTKGEVRLHPRGFITAPFIRLTLMPVT